MFKVGDRVISKLGEECWNILGKHGVVCAVGELCVDVDSNIMYYRIKFDGHNGKISSQYHPDNLMAEDEFLYIDDFKERIKDRMS